MRRNREGKGGTGGFRVWNIAALCMLGLGAIMFAVGWFSAPFKSENFNMTINNRVIVEAGEYEYDDRWDFPDAADLARISVRADGGRIEIAPAPEGSPLSVRASNLKPAVDYGERTLSVETEKSRRGAFGLGVRNRGRLTILVPRGSPATLDVSLASGDLQIEDVAADSLRLRMASGRACLSGLDFRDGSLDMSSGTAVVEDSTWRNLDIRKASGRIVIENAKVGEGGTSIDSSSGSTILGFVGNPEDFRYDLRLGSGTMRVNGEKVTPGTGSPGSGVFDGGNAVHEIVVRQSSGTLLLDIEP